MDRALAVLVVVTGCVLGLAVLAWVVLTYAGY